MHRVQTSVNQRKRDRETQRVRAIDGALETLVHNVNGSNNSVQNVYPWFSQPSAVFEYKSSHTHTHKMGTKGVQENTLARDASHWLTYSPSRYCTRGNNLSILKYKIFTFTQPKWCVWMENRSELFTKLATLVFALARLYPLFITELSWLFVSVSYFPYYNEISASFYHIFRLFRLFSAISIS